MVAFSSSGKVMSSNRTGWVMHDDGFWWYGNGDIKPKLMFPSPPWPKRHKPKAGKQLKLF